MERRGTLFRLLPDALSPAAAAVEVVKSEPATDSSSSLRKEETEGDGSSMCGSWNLTDRSFLGLISEVALLLLVVLMMVGTVGSVNERRGVLLFDETSV